MEEFQHKQLAGGSWQKVPFFEQMANIGSEVERAIGWREKGNLEYSQAACDRVLELLDLTIDDAKNQRRLRELLRLREVLADYFYSSNFFSSSDVLWEKYFFPFSWAARAEY
ncbi:MAG: hypothetical protein COV69_00950 [Parcubacteria group bacterium CG11_big_fil_rev_8_21_14_0_20_39_14]|nr:MAG: hypothetical protein COV69_00950 [Parcubacteria group bacterium CG11_big_fil_rev_8_21_14_0_20_39_14]PIS35578.1 MAG: hypothetical protein COT36_01750 [Parcubacteria group bacterium CG08_land_8_20_14_0_20_38_56]